MSCDCLPACPFFHGRMKNMPTTAEVLKQRYCMSDPEVCARCQIIRTLGIDAVPPDLFPHEHERAHDIIQLGREAQRLVADHWGSG